MLRWLPFDDGAARAGGGIGADQGRGIEGRPVVGLTFWVGADDVGEAARTQSSPLVAPESKADSAPSSTMLIELSVLPLALPGRTRWRCWRRRWGRRSSAICCFRAFCFPGRCATGTNPFLHVLDRDDGARSNSHRTPPPASPGSVFEPRRRLFAQRCRDEKSGVNSVATVRVKALEVLRTRRPQCGCPAGGVCATASEGVSFQPAPTPALRGPARIRARRSSSSAGGRGAHSSSRQC
jgi:hypothetical protein